ncbi:MAG: hypothetical protein SGPRY_013342 [Prymnesium sp.]
MLELALEQPFYGELRTQQQLGYIVQSGVSESEGVRGLSFLVQSSKLPPPQAVDVDKRLGQQAARFWGEIAQQRYDYGRPWRTAKRAKKVRREQLLEFFDKFVASDGPELRRLSTHVFAKRDAPASLWAAGVEQGDDFWPAPPDKLEAI